MEPRQQQNSAIDQIADQIVNLQRQLDVVRTDGQTAEKYRELTASLQKIRETCDATKVNMEELRDMRRKVREAAGLDENFPAQQLRDELSRFQAVSKVIVNLPADLAEAAVRGDYAIAVMYLDKEGAHSTGFLGRKTAPRSQDDLHSPAYRRLWDHLQAQGFSPTIQDCGYYGHAVVIKLPN